MTPRLDGALLALSTIHSQQYLDEVKSKEETQLTAAWAENSPVIFTYPSPYRPYPLPSEWILREPEPQESSFRDPVRVCQMSHDLVQLLGGCFVTRSQSGLKNDTKYSRADSTRRYRSTKSCFVTVEMASSSQPVISTGGSLVRSSTTVGG